MFQDFHRPDKTKFDVHGVKEEKKCIVPLLNFLIDAGIQALVREIKDDCELVQNGKKFLISLHGVMNKSPEESADYIYDEARQYWDYNIRVMIACTYAIDKEPSLFGKLVFYSNYDAPAQRMIKTINDPWLVYILGDDVLGHEQSNDFIRGFLSILIVYYNMKDLLFDKYKLGKYEPGRAPTSAYNPPINWKIESDVGIRALVREIKDDYELVQNGKKFLISLHGVMNKSPEESADYSYDEARQLWEFEASLLTSYIYALDKEPSLSDKLVFYSNYDPPMQRMTAMMNDPWLGYILGLKKSNDFIRGFLSILTVYWNMKDIFDKYKLGEYGPGRSPASTYTPPINVKTESIRYVIDRVDDFKNLREVLESKFGSDPDLVANLLEKISNFQVNEMRLSESSIWKPGKRAMIGTGVCSEDSGPFYVCKYFSLSLLP
ncbi:hypothetical protein CASFOL_028906 [Castilleja foliolosa]|uniref:Uncharacterized protein n=1 Tax=Castilleja foliolosa TaxID=1961234 RepID=A0ABD3CD98_9LAMI